mmetsp:Transcript_15524/g.28822  ORF Transcript_15524/g.28822 Transcript_15524/m.28822 type:complete len:349 (-) Transcript_15524:57-1103(-)
MAAPRQLLDIGFEGWDHRPASLYSSFIEGGVALILMFSACCCWKGVRQDQMILLAFLFFMMGSAVLKGTVDYKLDATYDANKPLGTDWEGVNTDWQYLWLASMICACFASTMLVQIALSPIVITEVEKRGCCHKSCADVLIGIVWLGALAFAGIIYKTDRVDNKIDDAQQYLVLFGMCMASVGAVINILCFLVGVCSCHFQRILIAIGCAFSFVSYGIIAFEPDECLQTGDARSGCPWPEEPFNQNAIFHFGKALCMLFVTLGMMCGQSWKDKYDWTTVPLTEPTTRSIETGHGHETVAPAKEARAPTFMEQMFCCNRKPVPAGGGHGAPTMVTYHKTGHSETSGHVH